MKLQSIMGNLLEQQSSMVKGVKDVRKRKDEREREREPA